MDKIITERILSAIGACTSRKSVSAAFADPRYEPVQFGKQNFHEIRALDEEHSVCFVDGSNVSIITTPTFSLDFIRVASVIYTGKKRLASQSKEFLALTSAGPHEKYEVETFPENSLASVKVSFSDQTMRFAQDKVTIARVPELLRSLSEIDYASENLETLPKNSCVVRDGSLMPKMSYELQWYSRLFSACREKRVALAGFCKTTDLLTDCGDSLACALRQIAPRATWHYSPLFINKNPEHPVQIGMVKLHPSSSYVFRFELLSDFVHMSDSILSSLAINSSDPVFLGYPYGLQQSHALAKISSSERSQMLTMFQSRAGKGWKSIEDYLRSVDAHDVLDSATTPDTFK
ncbi:MAG: DNA double-strand break repair nuclease NurA [Candidatus Woesearchaeota archaeon]